MPPLHVSVGQGCIHLVVVVLEVARGAAVAGRGAQRLRRRNAGTVAAQLPELLLGFVRQMLPENAAPVSVSACHNNESYQLTGDGSGAAAKDAATHPPPRSANTSEQQLQAAAAAASPGPPSGQGTAAEAAGGTSVAPGAREQEAQQQHPSERVPPGAPSGNLHALDPCADAPSAQSLNAQELASPFVGAAVGAVTGTQAADTAAPGEPSTVGGSSASQRPQGGRMPRSVNLLSPPPPPRSLGQRIHHLQLQSQPQRPLVHTSAPEFRRPNPGSNPSSEAALSPSTIDPTEDAASEPTQGARAPGPAGSRFVAPTLWSPLAARSSPSAVPSAGTGTPPLPGGAATPTRLLYRPVSRAGFERPSWSVLGPAAGAAPAPGLASAAGVSAGAGAAASVLSSRSMRFDVPESMVRPMLPPMPAFSELHRQAPPVGVELMGPMVRVHPSPEDQAVAAWGVQELALRMARVEQSVSTAGGSKESLVLVLRCPDLIVRRKSVGPAAAGQGEHQQERAWAALGTLEGQHREHSPSMEQEGEGRDEAGGAERQEADENSGSVSSSGRGAVAAGPVSQLVAWCRSGSVSVAQVDDSAAGVTMAVLTLQPQRTWTLQPRPAGNPVDAVAAAAAASDADLFDDMRPVRQRSSPLAIAAAAAEAAVPDLFSDSTAGDAVGEAVRRVSQARARSAAWGQVLMRPASTSRAHMLEAVLRTAEVQGSGMHEGTAGADHNPHHHQQQRQQLLQQMAVSVSSPNSIGREGHSRDTAAVPAGPSASASLHSGSMPLQAPLGRRAAPAAAVFASAESPPGIASTAATTLASGEPAQFHADAADGPLDASGSSAAGDNGGTARARWDTSPRSALAAERIRQAGAPATSPLPGGTPPPMLLLQVAWRRGQLLGPTCPVLLLPPRLVGVAAELVALQARLLPPSGQLQELGKCHEQQQQPRLAGQRSGRSSTTPAPEAAGREEVATAFRAFLTDLGTWLEAVLPVTCPGTFPAAAATSATTTLSSPAFGAQATHMSSDTGSNPLTDGSTGATAATAATQSPVRTVSMSPSGPAAGGGDGEPLPPGPALPTAGAEPPRAGSSTDGSTPDSSDRAHLVDEVLWLGCDLLVYTATCGLAHTTLLLLQHMVTYLATWPHTSRASVGTSGIASSILAAAFGGSGGGGGGGGGGGRWSRSGTSSSAGGTASGSSGSSQLLNSRLLPPLLQQQQESLVLCRVLESCQDCNEHGRSLLHIAVESGSMPLVRLLVQDLPYKYGNAVLDVLAAPDRRGVTAMQYLTAVMASSSGGGGGGRGDGGEGSAADNGCGGDVADGDGASTANGSSEGEGVGEDEGETPQSLAAALQRAFADAALELLQQAGVGQARRRLHVVLESSGSGVLPGQQQQHAREEQGSSPEARRARRSHSSSTHSNRSTSSSTISSAGGGSARSGGILDADVLLASPVTSSMSGGSRGSFGTAGLAAVEELQVGVLVEQQRSALRAVTLALTFALIPNTLLLGACHCMQLGTGALCSLAGAAVKVLHALLLRRPVQGEEDTAVRDSALALPARPALPWLLAGAGPPSARLWQPLRCLVLLLLAMLQVRIRAIACLVRCTLAHLSQHQCR